MPKHRSVAARSLKQGVLPTGVDADANDSSDACEEDEETVEASLVAPLDEVEPENTADIHDNCSHKERSGPVRSQTSPAVRRVQAFPSLVNALRRAAGEGID